MAREIPEQRTPEITVETPDVYARLGEFDGRLTVFRTFVRREIEAYKLFGRVASGTDKLGKPAVNLRKITGAPDIFEDTLYPAVPYQSATSGKRIILRKTTLLEGGEDGRVLSVTPGLSVAPAENVRDAEQLDQKSGGTYSYNILPTFVTDRGFLDGMLGGSDGSYDGEYPELLADLAHPQAGFMRDNISTQTQYARWLGRAAEALAAIENPE